MINEEIISYIQAQLRKNISESVIKSKLANVGWHTEDVEEAFRKLTPPEIKKEVKIEPIQSNKPDPYRELPSLDKKEDIGPKLEANPIPSEPSPVPKPIFAKSFSEANPKDDGVSYYIPTNAARPTFIPTDKKVEPTTTNFSVIKPKIVEVVENNTVSNTKTEETKKTNTEEFIPKLIPKPEIKPDYKKPVSSTDIPNNALLYSYPQDVFSSKPSEVNNAPVKKSSTLKLIAIVLTIGFITGGIFAFIYSNKPNISIIKQDPKILLVKAPEVLGSLNSYKIDTEATILTPSFADITNGLVNGEVINSNNKDSISLFAKGTVNNTKPKPVFDYSMIIKSSLFREDITSSIKSGSNGTFIVTPDLTKIFGRNAPTPSTVLVDNGQFGLLTNLLPKTFESKITKINFDKIFSVGLPSYITGETNSIFQDFLKNASVIEKDSEVVHNVDSYHYILSSDKQSTKKFLSSFVTFFLNELTEEEKQNLNEGIGSTNLDSLEIWIGKNDGNIHQYKFNLTTPLSKIIGLEDKGIAGSLVSFSWKTTYYDFDVANDIALPATSISMIDFMKKVEDMKLKDSILSFKEISNIFKNATGSYGKKTNPNGSCVNPNPGSLFSPVGHPKGANNSVGTMSEVINDILNITNGSLACYSSSNAWAISAPLLSDPNSYVCTDNRGGESILEKQITGPICK